MASYMYATIARLVEDDPSDPNANEGDITVLAGKRKNPSYTVVDEDNEGFAEVECEVVEIIELATRTGKKKSVREKAIVQARRQSDELKELLKPENRAGIPKPSDVIDTIEKLDISDAHRVVVHPAVRRMLRECDDDRVKVTEDNEVYAARRRLMWDSDRPKNEIHVVDRRYATIGGDGTLHDRSARARKSDVKQEGEDE